MTKTTAAAHLEVGRAEALLGGDEMEHEPEWGALGEEPYIIVHNAT